MDLEGFGHITECYQALHKGFEWGLEMHIPFKAVSPNPLTLRFSRMKIQDEEKFTFLEFEINREMTNKILNVMEGTKTDRDWYFEGPQGIGKSFTFLHLVLSLRKFHSEKFRVIYVNNPHAWRNDRWGYIVNEVIYAFAGDEEDFSTLTETQTLEKWYGTLYNAEPEKREGMLEKFLETIKIYRKKKGFKLIGVLDQENEVKELTKVFPFSFYNSITGRNFLFTCASANNWSSVNKPQSWQDLQEKIKIPIRDFSLPGRL